MNNESEVAKSFLIIVIIRRCDSDDLQIEGKDETR